MDTDNSMRPIKEFNMDGRIDRMKTQLSALILYIRPSMFECLNF